MMACTYGGLNAWWVLTTRLSCVVTWVWPCCASSCQRLQAPAKGVHARGGGHGSQRHPEEGRGADGHRRAVGQEHDGAWCYRGVLTRCAADFGVLLISCGLLPVFVLSRLHGIGALR